MARHSAPKTRTTRRSEEDDSERESGEYGSESETDGDDSESESDGDDGPYSPEIPVSITAVCIFLCPDLAYSVRVDYRNQMTTLGSPHGSNARRTMRNSKIGRTPSTSLPMKIASLLMTLFKLSSISPKSPSAPSQSLARTSCYSSRALGFRPRCFGHRSTK
jgi:hypothetical protein